MADLFKPDGSPRFIRCYDSGEGHFDRYTVVFTGRYRHRTDGEYYYLAMSENPRHPQGFGQHGTSREPLDYAAYKHLGRKITYFDLPEGCRSVVLQDYLVVWKTA